jgi:hypothetical protein
VPSVDGPVISVQMLLRTKMLIRFEQREIYAAKVLNVSSVGRQLPIPNARAI